MRYREWPRGKNSRGEKKAQLLQDKPPKIANPEAELPKLVETMRYKPPECKLTNIKLAKAIRDKPSPPHKVKAQATNT